MGKMLKIIIVPENKHDRITSLDSPSISSLGIDDFVFDFVDV